MNAAAVEELTHPTAGLLNRSENVKLCCPMLKEMHGLGKSASARRHDALRLSCYPPTPLIPLIATHGIAGQCKPSLIICTSEIEQCIIRHKLLRESLHSLRPG